MILPTKHIPNEQALLGVGAELLQQMNRAMTVSSLWEKVKDNANVATFERFILGLDFLYLLGAVSLSEGLLRREKQ